MMQMGVSENGVYNMVYTMIYMCINNGCFPK